MEPAPQARSRRWIVTLPFLAIVVLAAAWCGFWFYAAGKAEETLNAWMEREAAAGRTYACSSRSIEGFPFRIEVRCADPTAELKLAPTPLVIRAKEVHAVAQVYDPTLIIAEIAGPLSIAEQGQKPTHVADWTLAQASLRGHPSAPDRISMVLAGPKIAQAADGGATTLASARRIELHLRRGAGSAEQRPGFDVAAQATGATVPDVALLAQRPLDAEIAGTLRGVDNFAPKPLNATLRAWQAAGGRLDIASARVRQGDAVAQANGEIGLSPAGRLDGTLRVTAAGFDGVIQSLVGSASSSRRQLSILAGVAGLSFLGEKGQIDGKPALTLNLRFADGAAFLGPIPIGQTAPVY